MWSLQYLTDVRRFLLGWSLLGRSSGDIRRLDQDRGGVFAKRLLDHLDGIRDDRLKTGADLIVQAARGYLRNEKDEWVRRYKPVHVILFEDLSRYRMRTDRPRRENAQLMQWAHRAVPDTVCMQGELYGLEDRRRSDKRRGGSRAPRAALCLDIPAAFSSRYRAATMTPGIRCHPLTARDLANASFREMLERENPSLALDLDRRRPGDLVPLAGGEIFVCLEGDGLAQIHADINAAHNLQRRFWTRHGEAFRLPCQQVTVDGSVVWVPVSLGERLRGALGGPGVLTPTGDSNGSCRWTLVTPARWKRPSGTEAADEERDLDPELAGLEDELLERSGKRVVFFRDPSGVVLPAGLWFPFDTFWGIVKSRTAARLLPKD